jgi:hypothetical protein
MALSKIDIANMLTGATPVANGGTGLTAGTTNQFLKFTGTTTLASAAITTGKVLQVVNSSSASPGTVNDNNYADVGFTTSITPSASGNPIYLHWYMPDNRIQTNNTNMNSKIYRQINGGGYSALTQTTGGTGYNGGTTMTSCGTSGVFVDSSHSTTNQIDYKLYFNSGQNVQAVKVNVDGTSHTGIMAMEIEA